MKQWNNKKKIVFMYLACLLLAAMALGCGSGKEEPKESGSQKADGQEDPEEKEGSTESYMIDVNGVQFGINMDSETVVEALGEPEEYFEGESCVSMGLEKYYRYPGYSFSTYEKDGKHLIAYISITEDTITTAEGIGLGSVKNDVLKAYGNNNGDVQGLMKFKKGDMALNIWMEGERVTGIEFQKNWSKQEVDQQTQAPVCCP